jgi:hypothetical protein
MLAKHHWARGVQLDQECGEGEYRNREDEQYCGARKIERAFEHEASKALENSVPVRILIGYAKR